MAKISLRAYDHEIEDLIERGHHLEEVIAHCRHIINRFPKHLATYRLLGKAYLEAKRYRDAVDVFQRVLLAAPEDFVSHVGMSIIADDQGKLDDAIWHMERAFEVQPSNAAIQGELQRLFGRRDGVEPPKIRLTRGALAHMYVRGDLYSQAVSEIRSVLDDDPKRADMQVLLAKAYFRGGQKAEAADLCTGLLTWYPYCRDANGLMVEILRGTERADSAQEYRQRLVELDPYLGFVPDSVADSERVADTAVTLERLQEVSETAGAGDAPRIGLAADAAAKGLNAGQPSWLAGESADNANSPSLWPERDIPDFLRQARRTESDQGAQEAIEQVAARGQPVQDVVPGWLPDGVKALALTRETPSEGEPQATEEELPEWLQSMGRVENGAVRPASEGLSEPEPPLWFQSVDDRNLDGLAQATESAGQDLLGIGPQAKTGSSDRAEASKVPANETVGRPGPIAVESAVWTKDLDAEIETPAKESEPSQSWRTQAPAMPTPHMNLNSLGTTSNDQGDALSWLESNSAKHAPREDELVTDPNAGPEAGPGWMDKTMEIGEPAPYAADARDSTSGAQPAPSESDLPAASLGSAGLNHEATVSPMAGPTRVAEPPSRDWLSGLSERDDTAGTEAHSEKEETPTMGQHEEPGWLSDLAPRVSKNPSIDTAPAWLNAGASKAPKGPAGTTAEPPAESLSATDLPDWLAGLDEDESGSPAEDVQSDELAAWLRPGRRPAAPTAVPTRPADWQPAEAAESAGAVTSGTTSAVEHHGASDGAGAASVLSEDGAESPAPASVVPGLKASPATASGAGGTSLGGAKLELRRGNIAAALDIYDRLIRKGKSLEEIIRDLRDALYRYPVEVPIWQALGDAYMRANRLQEALDAYTKAEELLR